MSGTLDAVVIGAGPAGLASAACLGKRGLKAVILEKSGTVGAVWRRHYDRLHLHSDRWHSALPGLPMPVTDDRYPSRIQVIDYLETYARRFDLKPVFNACVEDIQRDGEDWRVRRAETPGGGGNVAAATGWADSPYSPSWPGIERFGRVLHS